MSSKVSFPTLKDFEPTRRTLHLVAQAVSVVSRTHGKFHPKWRHVSLKVRSDGLVTDRIALPNGGEIWFKIDLRQHKAILYRDRLQDLISDDNIIREFRLTGGLSGLTATQFGDQVLGSVADLGLSGDYDRARFENDDPREYDPQAAEFFLQALVSADRVFKKHRSQLSGEIGPVQFWPHGFDLAFEWFGTRVETSENNREIQEIPSQLNLGFYPGDPDNPPYFYSNPWPFDAQKLLGQSLPVGVSWHTEGWQGTILPYDELAGVRDAEERLANYAQVVFELCTPTLIASRSTLKQVSA